MQNEDKLITIRCACGKGYRVPAEKAGGQARCGACGQAIPIPAVDLSPQHAEPAAAADEAEDADDPLAALMQASDDESSKDVSRPVGERSAACKPDAASDHEAPRERVSPRGGSTGRRHKRTAKQTRAKVITLSIAGLIGAGVITVVALVITGVIDVKDPELAEKANASKKAPADEKDQDTDGDKAEPGTDADDSSPAVARTAADYQPIPPKELRIPIPVLAGDERLPLERIEGNTKNGVYFCAAIGLQMPILEGWTVETPHLIGSAPNGLPGKQMLVLTSPETDPSKKITIALMLTRNDDRDFTALGFEEYGKAVEEMRVAVYEDFEDLPENIEITDTEIGRVPFKLAFIANKPSAKNKPQSILYVGARGLFGVVFTVVHGPDAEVDEVRKLLGMILFR